MNHRRISYHTKILYFINVRPHHEQNVKTYLHSCNWAAWTHATRVEGHKRQLSRAKGGTSHNAVHYIA